MRSKRLGRFLRLAWLSLLPVLLSQAQELTLAQQAIADAVEKRLLAPCCWNETVAEHRSDEALAIRVEAAKLAAAGRSEAQILETFKERYGMRILTEPDDVRWWWMNLVPVLALLAGLALVVIVLRRLLRRRPSSSP